MPRILYFPILLITKFSPRLRVPRIFQNIRKFKILLTAWVEIKEPARV